MPLTPPQEKVLAFIRQHIDSHGWAPTLREIGNGLGYSSPNTARQHVMALEKKGWVERGPGARALRGRW